MNLLSMPITLLPTTTPSLFPSSNKTTSRDRTSSFNAHTHRPICMILRVSKPLHQTKSNTYTKSNEVKTEEKASENFDVVYRGYAHPDMSPEENATRLAFHEIKNVELGTTTACWSSDCYRCASSFGCYAVYTPHHVTMYAFPLCSKPLCHFHARKYAKQTWA